MGELVVDILTLGPVAFIGLILPDELNVHSLELVLVLVVSGVFGGERLVEAGRDVAGIVFTDGFDEAGEERCFNVHATSD